MRSSDGLKVGVVGLGFIGPAHVEALRRLGIEVVGLFYIRPEQVADKAEYMRIGKVYATYDEMVADPAINVVHITSPNHVHYPQEKPHCWEENT